MCPYVTFSCSYNVISAMMADLFMTHCSIFSCICRTLLGFTVALQSHCAPGRPPVSHWLEHSGPVCQLLDICLLPPASVVMTANPPLSPTDPSPSLAGLLHPSLVFPPDTSCEQLMLILQSPRFSHINSTLSKTVLGLLIHSMLGPCLTWLTDIWDIL